jgi:hypothetical protein
MGPIPRLSLLAVASVLLLSGLPLSGYDPAWVEKSIPQWDDQDAKQILTESPWVKNVKLERVRDLSEFERRDGGNWEAGLKPGVGLAGLDLFGIGDLFGVGGPFASDSESFARELARRLRSDLPIVAVRWESALPVRAAEKITGAAGLPAWQGDYYAISVHNVTPPFRWNLANELKDIAFLKRDKKKDLKPSRVEIERHDDGLMTVVYLFPRSAGITIKDSNVRFIAQIGRMFISQFFFPEEMQFQGKPEL